MAGTYTNLLTHVVFSTKNREPMIPETLEGELYAYIRAIIDGERGKTIGIGGISDHLHILAVFPHAVALSEMMRRIKGGSSTWINRERKIPGHFAWQGGYGAFSVSPSQKESVLDYIRTQKEHHRTTSFKEEFLEFLQRHDVDYDERFVWD